MAPRRWSGFVQFLRRKRFDVVQVEAGALLAFFPGQRLESEDSTVLSLGQVSIEQVSHVRTSLRILVHPMHDHQTDQRRLLIPCLASFLLVQLCDLRLHLLKTLRVVVNPLTSLFQRLLDLLFLVDQDFSGGAPTVLTSRALGRVVRHQIVLSRLWAASGPDQPESGRHD